jgi:hypothetical protein
MGLTESNGIVNYLLMPSRADSTVVFLYMGSSADSTGCTARLGSSEGVLYIPYVPCPYPLFLLFFSGPLSEEIVRRTAQCGICPVLSLEEYFPLLFTYFEFHDRHLLLAVWRRTE